MLQEGERARCLMHIRRQGKAYLDAAWLLKTTNAVCCLRAEWQRCFQFPVKCTLYCCWGFLFFVFVFWVLEEKTLFESWNNIKLLKRDRPNGRLNGSWGSEAKHGMWVAAECRWDSTARALSPHLTITVQSRPFSHFPLSYNHTLTTKLRPDNYLYYPKLKRISITAPLTVLMQIQKCAKSETKNFFIYFAQKITKYKSECCTTVRRLILCNSRNISLVWRTSPPSDLFGKFSLPHPLS